jgi:P27 family predicted phage terminase small subunit
VTADGRRLASVTASPPAASSAAPPAPRRLSRASRSWWRTIVGDFELEPHHLRLLEAACRSWDRMTEAGAILRDEGIVVQDRYGSPKAHPAVGVERDARIAFARLLRELDLDGEPGPDPRIPRR